MRFGPTTLLDASFLLAAAAWVLAYRATGRRMLHLLQLEDYEVSRLLRLTLLQSRSDWRSGIEAAGAVLAVAGMEGLMYSTGATVRLPLAMIYGGTALWIVGSGLRTGKLNTILKGAKKPLAMTSRARRIFWVSQTIGAAVAPLTMYYLPGTWRLWALPTFFIVERLSPVWLALAVAILSPQERFLQRRFIADARRILSEVKPLVVGITGSYGKTGTKEILAALLETKFNLLRPPGSFNTIMGVTRVVREQLRPYHEAFVVEMGAYRIGSISKLCELTRPRHGIITTIGVQHLERFKTQAEIQRAKGELIRALPKDGVAVLNGDDPLCREIGAAHEGELIYFSAMAPDSKIPTLVVTNIEIGQDGSSFKIRFPDGSEQQTRLSLLGRGAIMNAAAAAALADRLGVDRKNIARTLENMPQVRHRLEPIQSDGGVTVIDDAYNSNPVGAAGALEVLAQSKTGRRVLVTPGMVELGELEIEANHRFGTQAASACDLVVLIGPKRTIPIQKGLKAAGFKAEKIWVEASIGAALKRLEGWLKPGDVMLLENDLPDQYSE